MKNRIRKSLVLLVSLGTVTCQSDDNPLAGLTSSAAPQEESTGVGGQARQSSAVRGSRMNATSAAEAGTVVRVVSASQAWLPITQLAQYPARGDVRRPESFMVRTDISCSPWRVAVYSDTSPEPPANQNCAWGIVWQSFTVSPGDACYPSNSGYFTARVSCAYDASLVAYGYGNMLEEYVPEPPAPSAVCGDGVCDAAAGEGCYGLCPGDCPC
jgi:hypothetical protein